MRHGEMVSKAAEKGQDKENMPSIAVANHEKQSTPMARLKLHGALEASNTFDKRNVKSFLPLAAPTKQSYNS